MPLGAGTRPASEVENERLVRRLGVEPPPRVLETVEVATLTSLEEFGHLRTNLATIGGLAAQTTAGRDVFLVSELFVTWMREDCKDGFGRDLVLGYPGDAEDPAFEPMPLLEDAPSGWRVVDGNHRAAAFFEFHRRCGASKVRVNPFLREPL